MKARAALSVLIVLAGALPLLAAQPAPLQDWPNHLARIHVLIGLLHGDPFWARFYRFTGFLIPDATMDLSLLALTRLGLPVATAGSVFLLATYAVFVGGFCALARAVGAAGPEKPAFAVLLFYGGALFWGLVSYMLGLGMLMVLLAPWLTTPRGTRRLGLAAAGSALLLSTHVVAAVAWAATLGCLDLRNIVLGRPRRVLDHESGLLALVVIVVLLRAMPGGTGHDLTVVYSGIGASGLALHKVRLFYRVLLGGSTLQDAASLLALLVCVGAVLLSRPRLPPAIGWPVAGLLLLTLAAPERIGTGSLLDQRLVILPLLVAAACARLRIRPAALWAVRAAVLLRTLVLLASFHASGAVFSDFRHRSADLPAGAVMLMGYGRPLPSLSWAEVWSPPLTSVATQVVFRGLFVPHVFANPAQQPMELLPAFQDLTQPWNLTDAAHLTATATALRQVCTAQSFAGVYLTVLYPGTFIAAHAGAALLAATPNYLILDACRLPSGVQ